MLLVLKQRTVDFYFSAGDLSPKTETRTLHVDWIDDLDRSSYNDLKLTFKPNLSISRCLNGVYTGKYELIAHFSDMLREKWLLNKNANINTQIQEHKNEIERLKEQLIV